MKIDAIAEIKKKFVENFFLPKVHALGIERDNTANESRPGNLHVGKKIIVMRNRWLAASVINESCKIFQGKTRR
jgi:hypothetical protein